MEILLPMRETVVTDVVVVVLMVVMEVTVDTEDADVATNNNVVVTNHAATPITAAINITTRCVTIINTMCATNTDTTSTTTTTTPAATHIATTHVAAVATTAAVEEMEVETRDRLKITATWNPTCKRREVVMLLLLTQISFGIHSMVVLAG